MEDERMPSLDPAAQSQVKSWRVRADEAGVAFFFTATPAFIILALAPASWQGLIFLVGSAALSPHRYADSVFRLTSVMNTSSSRTTGGRTASRGTKSKKVALAQ
jgi:hypothetical protein